jgi:hypothetical protein
MSSVVRRFRFIDGEVREVVDERLLEADGVGTTSGYSEGKPGRSISMGCHPEQVGLLNDTMKAHGVKGVEYTPDGDCIITSRRGRSQAMKVFGNMVGITNCHDGDGGYGD